MIQGNTILFLNMKDSKETHLMVFKPNRNRWYLYTLLDDFGTLFFLFEAAVNIGKAFELQRSVRVLNLAGLMSEIVSLSSL